MTPDEPMSLAQSPTAVESLPSAPAPETEGGSPVRDFLLRFALVARELFAHPFAASAIAPSARGYVVGRGKTLEDAIRSARARAAARSVRPGL